MATDSNRPDKSLAVQRLLLGANLIDVLLLSLLVLVLFASGVVGNFGSVGSPDMITIHDRSVTLFWILVTIFIFVVYQVLTELLFGGRTVGKMVMGLEAQLDGEPHIPLHVRFQRLGLRASFAGVRYPRRDGVPAHDHKLGISYNSPMLAFGPEPARDRDWLISILNGSRRGQKIPASKLWRFRKRGRIQIGRDPRWADIVLKDLRVSRRHAVMEADGLRMDIFDVGSRHGTRVNGREIPRDVSAELGNPGRISLGGVEIEVSRHRIRS